MALPGTVPLAARLSLPRVRIRMGPAAAALALGSLVAAVFVLVLLTASGPSLMVARSLRAFPGWEAGPLHGLFGAVPPRFGVLIALVSLLIVAMLAAYAVALASIRSLSLRTLVMVVVALHLILLMTPPMLSSDLFNYLGYARLGGLHGLNPYQNVIAQELHDPVYTFTTWRHLHSPYGPLFTAASYGVGRLPLPVAYWLLKLLTVTASLGLLALVGSCARRLGRDPRLAIAFVALNPIYLIYAVGGFHNDFFMLLPAVGAVALLLSGRERAAGALLMVAVAVKFNAIVLLPFMLVALRPAARRWRLLAGASVSAIVLAGVSLAVFGPSLPNLSDQTTLITGYSIPNLFGLAIGAGGGTPLLLKLFAVALVATVIWLLLRPGDWLSRAGWAMLAVIASMGWLMPWYVIWAAPLAALARSDRLRRATLAFTVFLVVAAVPDTSHLMHQHGIGLLDGSAGQASRALERTLAQ
jgi:Glycosyltransferase family 87